MVILEFNGANYTLPLAGSYYEQVLFVDYGSYTWRIIANDTNNIFNTSTQTLLVVRQLAGGSPSPFMPSGIVNLTNMTNITNVTAPKLPAFNQTALDDALAPLKDAWIQLKANPLLGGVLMVSLAGLYA